MAEENKDEILVIVNDSHQYAELAEVLSSYGLVENVHFFNGWKLSLDFYHQYYGPADWIKLENKNQSLLRLTKEGWRQRAKALSTLIPDSVHSLMDIGCGEGYIRDFLPDDCKYFGVDYCKRSDDTIICDINKEPLPAIDVDAYYMAGSLCYVKDPFTFLRQLTKAQYNILSYIRKEGYVRIDGRIVDNYLGFGEAELFLSDLISYLYCQSFVCEKLEWNYRKRDEYYCRFKNIHKG